MIPSPRIGNLFFYVSDIDRTERFYRDVIGLNIERMPDDGEGRPWLNAPIPGNVDLIFFFGEVRPGNSPIVVFDLREGGIDGAVQRLASAGTKIITPVSHAPGGWSAEFADPDGYVLSMYQTAEQPR
ncbi:MAG: VOC family protein [Gemmatimonadaceae bacterium]|nr:VOC family protein [Gemmatimonadaceae bacterium]MCW5826455.1 VOC family protein [Gemmatimonadaceae bacterium]